MPSYRVLKSNIIDMDRSPVCKRARYDSDSSERWTLSRNELILHSVYDSGVDRLASDSEFDLAIELQKHNKQVSSKGTPTTKGEQIAILAASLPENTLQKLSMGELDIALEHEPGFSCNNTGQNYFDMLSDEVVLTIFHKLTKSQLGTVALVCKRFSELVQDESLWSKLDVSNKVLAVGALGVILSRQVMILKLARTRIKSPLILPNFKAALPDYRSRLLYLDLTMANISIASLETIFDKCRRLKKLSLESVAVDDAVLQALSLNKDIEILNFSMTVGIGLEGLKALLTNCRKIRELNLAWTYLCSDSIEYVCDHLPSTLDRLNFAGCRKLLHDENVAQIVDNCPKLHELDLSDCTSITGVTVMKLTLLNGLNFLSLSRCYLIPFRSLLCLKNMKSLSYLDIHGSCISVDEFKVISDGLGSGVNINNFKFSSIARPTVGIRRAKIWDMKVRD